MQEPGFDAVYMPGAGLTRTCPGMPDPGSLTLVEPVGRGSTIAEAVAALLVPGADTGFGDACNVPRTDRRLERARVSPARIGDTP